MKSTYKNCSAGHFYPASLDKCPFCKGEQNEGKIENNAKEGDEDKTMIMSGENLNSGDRTMNINENKGDLNKTEVFGQGQNNLGSIGNTDKTMIFSSSGKAEENAGKVPTLNTSRKLVGWLVSFTLNEFGIDFRLYEGQNVIGRDLKSDIRIVEDTSISSKHATILYRNGAIYFRDEMSTNPSFLNEEEIMPGNTVKLVDGAQLQVGNTLFTLRLCII